MSGQKLIAVCMLAFVFFSCRKNTVREELIVAPSGPAQTVTYDESQILRVPGNYQEWKVSLAPKIVSVKSDGEYEGYINFTLADTEFWLVRGTEWDNVHTYNETGNYTFGQNGDYFKLSSGAGVYRVNASTNTFKWSCTKINDWSINGSAAGGGDEEMVFNPANLSWTITKNLSAGDFVFRANKSNEIQFGHNNETETGMLAYNGDKIQLTQNGNYTIVLSLRTAGAYIYSIRRNL
jgi:plastocyanin